MRRFVPGVTAAAFAACALVTAQTPTPFKLGTFELRGRTFVGIVLRDTVVIDLAAANAAIRTPASSVAAPADMKDLIARYDAGVRHPDRPDRQRGRSAPRPEPDRPTSSIAKISRRCRRSCIR